jgi:hypothetical protein
MLTVALRQLELRVAVIVAVASEVAAEAVALNVAELAPAATWTVAGTVTGPVAWIASVAPETGAAADNPAVQVVDPGAFTVDGLQLRLVTVVNGATVTLAVRVMAPAMAVTVMPVDAVTLAAVAVNDVLVAPWLTVAVVGTGSAEPLLAKLTPKPPDGAALVNATVQLTVCPEFIVAGLHDRLDRAAGAAMVRLAVRAPPFSDAVTLAVASAATVLAVAVKVAESAPEPTETVEGTVTGPFEPSWTTAPPAGAAPDRETVQAVEEP